jgi:hypothetical protein
MLLTFARVVVALAAVAVAVLAVQSAVRTIVVPRGVPDRLARAVFPGPGYTHRVARRACVLLWPVGPPHGGTGHPPAHGAARYLAQCDLAGWCGHAVGARRWPRRTGVRRFGVSADHAGRAVRCWRRERCRLRRGRVPGWAASPGDRLPAQFVYRVLAARGTGHQAVDAHRAAAGRSGHPASPVASRRAPEPADRNLAGVGRLVR